MKLQNCLLCCCHIDNREEKCKGKRHIFNISTKQVEKYDWAIKYIKDEIKTGRHIIACLGSAGYSSPKNIEMLANYAYGIGDKYFYKIIKN